MRALGLLDHRGAGNDAEPVEEGGSGAVSRSWVRRVASRSQPRGVRLAELGEPVAQPGRLLGRQPGMVALVSGLAVFSETVASPKARSSGPEATSTSCIRPYGTATRLRNKTPWVM